MLYSAQKVSFRTTLVAWRSIKGRKRKKSSRSRPTHATTTATTILMSRMLDIKDLKLLEFQFFVFDNNLIFSDFIDFLIIKSLKSRKNTWILLLISISSLPSSQNGIRIYLNINIPVAHCEQASEYLGFAPSV